MWEASSSLEPSGGGGEGGGGGGGESSTERLRSKEPRVSARAWERERRHVGEPACVWERRPTDQAGYTTKGNHRRVLRPSGAHKGVVVLHGRDE